MAKVLVAEHNPSTTEYLSGALRRAGNVVDTVDNCLDAWRASSSGAYDILLIDIMMPGIDGFVLAQKALQENPELQIIFVTGFAGVSMDAAATPAYAPAPITSRPFHLKEIAQRVRYMMGLGGLPLRSYQTGADNVIYANFTDKNTGPHQQAQ